MEQSLATVSAAADQAASTETDQTSPFGRASAAPRGLGAGRLLVLGATALGLCVFLLLRVAEPHYTLLYGDLELEDSAAIVGRLEALGLSFRLQDDGRTILVAADQASRLRMTLAEEGLPRGGRVGDEIFDQRSALGTTDFLANVNLRRTLEGELARTITSLADVRSARVHLVLPRRELLRQQIEPSASVTLHLHGRRRLDHRQMQAVQHLVAAAVPKLSPERVTLVDARGTLLARGGEGDPESVFANRADKLRQAHEGCLTRTIEDLLERSLGPGRAHAEATAELDLDRVTAENFDPDGQAVHSTQTIEEKSRLAERDDGAASVGNILQNAAADTPAAARTSNENTTRTEDTADYEISRRLRSHTHVGGGVERLSVTVLVDGRMEPNAKGELIYTPLDASELDEMASLVRSAIGFDEARGDVVEVKSIPFSTAPAADAAPSWWQLSKYDPDASRRGRRAAGCRHDADPSRGAADHRWSAAPRSARRHLQAARYEIMTSPFRFEKRFRDGGKRGAAGDAALPRCGSVDAGVAPVDLPSLERSAVLGKTTMSDTQLLRLGRGAVVALDRKVGESIDILFHNRLLARGEAVILDNLSRGTMTEINESEP